MVFPHPPAARPLTRPVSNHAAPFSERRVGLPVVKFSVLHSRTPPLLGRGVPKARIAGRRSTVLRASTYSCTRVDELSTNRVRSAQLSCVDSQTRGRLRSRQGCRA